MLATNAMLARASARPVAARRQRAVAAKASAVEKASPSNEAGVTMRAREIARVGKTVLSGVVAAGLASAVAPEPALAVSLRDPVFGDIEVWQFIVLTAGYWWGIEFYLDNKYDKPKPGKVMPKVSAAKKAEVGANKTFAEANAAKEAENEQ